MANKKPKSLCLLLLISSLAIGQNGPVPPTYFGMHDNNQDFTGSNYPVVPFGTFRIWDKEPINWYEVETARGVYNWTAFDTIMNKLTVSGVTDVLYTFGYTPPWATGGAGTSGHSLWSCLPPTNNQDMIDFISAVATRYKGRIKHYETWNEPFGAFFCGTMTQLVQIQNDVYTTVKAIDPTAQVHSPTVGLSATPGDCTNASNGPYNFGAFMTALGDPTKVDAIDVHLYPYPDGTFPESSPGTIFTQLANAKCTMAQFGISSKPLWNTEFSWYRPSLPTGTDLPAMVARTFLYFWSQGVSRSYWYAYDNPDWGTLFNFPTGLTLTAAGVAYQQVYNWMVGSTMNTPCVASGTVWTCGLINSAGAQTLAVWNTAGSSTYTPAPQYADYKDLAGTTHSISGTVTIGIQPLLFVGAASLPAPPSGLTAAVQ